MNGDGDESDDGNEDYDARKSDSEDEEEGGLEVSNSWAVLAKWPTGVLVYMLTHAVAVFRLRATNWRKTHRRKRRNQFRMASRYYSNCL